MKNGFLCMKVAQWKFDQTQPIQCYRCQKFGHNQLKCDKDQVCVVCAGKHKLKDCPDKSKPKCINCNGAHAACYKECPKNKAATTTPQRFTERQKTCICQDSA